MYIYIYIYTYMYMYIYIYIYIYTCVCIYIYIYIHTHIVYIVYILYILYVLFILYILYILLNSYSEHVLFSYSAAGASPAAGHLFISVCWFTCCVFNVVLLVLFVVAVVLVACVLFRQPRNAWGGSSELQGGSTSRLHTRQKFDAYPPVRIDSM